MNRAIWSTFFKVFDKWTDNTGIVLLLVTVFVAILFSIPSSMSKNRFIRSFFGHGYFGFLDFGYFVSVYYFLRELPLIHPRIKNILSTTSYIILHSKDYKRVFESYAKITVNKSSDVVYFLYGLSPEQLEDTKFMNPTMLYAKVCDIMKETRYAFGGFVDMRFPEKYHYIFLGLFVILAVFAFFIVEEECLTRCTVSYLILLSFYLSSSRFMSGLVVAVSVYILAKIICSKLFSTTLFFHIKNVGNFKERGNKNGQS